MEDDIVKFLEKDSIDMSKFFANSEILKTGTVEIYQSLARLHNFDDISAEATKTIQWIALPYNQPLGYAGWFIAAYPDVVKWLSDLEEETLLTLLGSDTDVFDVNQNFTLPVLRKIVDVYKVSHELECS